MKTKILVILAAVLMSIEVVAVPITYDVTFDGSVSGPAGTGVLVHDAALAASDQITAFSWDFGSGLTGALVPSVAIFDKILFGILDGTNSTTNVWYLSPVVSGSFSKVAFCGLSNSATCDSVSATPAYHFNVVGGANYTGVVSISESQIPEPTTLALMGLGLAGIGYRRKRKLAA